MAQITTNAVANAMFWHNASCMPLLEGLGVFRFYCNLKRRETIISTLKCTKKPQLSGYP